ncbi:hypothetical protein ACOANU_29170 [Pseudomonas aeruginosa]|uniref:hypothetical protein n=1 Tax=Pseudomonas aeruginosa TaxID=287 RepID=UPI000936B4EB|nr:hypothetical protein [Pseudomonas aeruginosa]EKJ8513836.1 hypothetical protein [Pseudomonas aeruginosa]ELK7310580.1 hypothetical protein [Pseudomonas aeruginosa]ELP0277593.1 hypothetical protein [Pseudomonas aeruginosa]ELP1285883.1 hypothetical protein [Pseudomonas aeruginosa]MCV6582184.1 hypothetical protein [Pseudomonas aeruginosa]
MKLAGNEIKKLELIRRVVTGLRPTERGVSEPRWRLVMDTFHVGFAESHSLCHEFSLDPDEMLRSDTP